MKIENPAIKVGIIGTNFISDLFCEAARSLGLEVCAVYSRSEEVARAFAQKHGIENTFTDFDTFCKSEVINSAYIASPICCHFPQAKALLEHGKHVLCEKAITSNSEQLTILREIAKERNLTLLEAMRPAFDPVYEILRENIQRCGKIRNAHFEFCQYSSRYDKFKKGVIENAFNPALSNAAVMDIGIYCIYLCAMYFGKPDSVTSKSVILGNGFEGQGEAILGYDDMTATVRYSKISQSHTPSYILGENGQLTFGYALPKINTVTFTSNDGKVHDITINAAPNNMVYEIVEFDKSVREGFCDDRHIAVSEIAISVAEQIRRQNCIIFPDDK